MFFPATNECVRVPFIFLCLLIACSHFLCLLLDCSAGDSLQGLQIQGQLNLQLCTVITCCQHQISTFLEYGNEQEISLRSL